MKKEKFVAVICLSVLAALDASASWPYDRIDKVDVDPMETLVSNWRPAPFAKKVGSGRVFYTSFGHDRGAYLDAPRAYHMLLGVQFALGDVEY